MKEWFKRKKKTGFTLLELLAVIVILAIIALIVSPFVTKAIKEARKGAFKNTAYGIVASLDVYQSQKLETGFINTTFLYSNYLETNSANSDSLPYKGKKPKNGIVLLRANGKVEMAISDGNYCAYKFLDKAEIEVVDRECPDDILSKYIVNLELIEKTNTTIQVKASIIRGASEYYFKIDNGSFISNLDKSIDTFTFGELTPGTEHEIVAKAKTEDGDFVSEVLKVTTNGYSMTSEVVDITNTTIKVRSKISSGDANYYFKIGNGTWVNNATLMDGTYEFTGLTKNTEYKINTKSVNDYGEYSTDELTVKTTDLNDTVIQYQSATFNPCKTGKNTCVPGYEGGYTECVGTNTGWSCSSYKCPSCGDFAPGTCPWSLNGKTCSKQLCHCPYLSSTECSLYSNHCTSLQTEDGLRYCDSCTTKETETAVCAKGTSTSTCTETITVQGSYVPCKTGSNTCTTEYEWGEWGTVKPSDTREEYCKKRICSVGTNGTIIDTNCVDCGNCLSTDDIETCEVRLTPPEADLQSNSAGGWTTHKEGNNWITYSSSNIYVHGEPNSRKAVYAYKNYDVTDYKTLTVSYSTNGYTGQGDWVINISVGSQSTYKVIAHTGTRNYTQTLDVSSLTGVQTIKVGGTAQPEGGDVSFKSIKLSKE